MMKIKEIFELGELFETVQMQSILEDGKTFPDCIPKLALDEISKKYEDPKNRDKF